MAPPDGARELLPDPDLDHDLLSDPDLALDHDHDLDLDRDDGSEQARIEEALVRAGHVQARAARLLGMSVRQLRWRIGKYGIAVERF